MQKPFENYFGGAKQEPSRSNQGYQNRDKGSKKPNPWDPIFNKIRSFKELKTGLTPEVINLPEGLADKAALLLKNERDKINTNQLRKFFSLVKDVEVYYVQDFDEALNSLYAIVPLIAYSVGRKHCPKNFYLLMKECITPTKIKDKDDIKALIDFFEAIVAYFKFYEGDR